MKTTDELTAEIEAQIAIRKNKNSTPYFKRKAKARIDLLRGFLALYERGLSEDYVLNKIVKLDKQYAEMKDRFMEHKDNWKTVLDKDGVKVEVPPTVAFFERETGAKKIKQQSSNLKLIL